MNDLIDRKATIDYLVTNMGWYDEDGYTVDDYYERRNIIAELINGVPTVDAVSVVRCKDCKYRNEEITVPAPEESQYKSFTFASCPCKSFNLGDDFFCGKGKRKGR